MPNTYIHSSEFNLEKNSQHPEALRNMELYRFCKDARVASGWEEATKENIDFYLGNQYKPEQSDMAEIMEQDDPIIDRVYASIDKFE